MHQRDDNPLRPCRNMPSERFRRVNRVPARQVHGLRRGPFPQGHLSLPGVRIACLWRSGSPLLSAFGGRSLFGGSAFEVLSR